MKYLATLILSIPVFGLFGQNDTYTPWFSLDNTSVVFGLNEGSHTNLTSGRMNVYAGLESALTIKNIPFTFSGRISSEKYISGKPSYIRLSYDGYRNHKLEKADFEDKLKGINGDIAELNDSLYQLEGKIAYWKLKKEQLSNQQIPDLNSSSSSISSTLQNPNINLNNPISNVSELGQQSLYVDTLNPEFAIPALSNEIENPKWGYLDSISNLISGYEKSLNEVSKITDSLNLQKQDYINKINQLDLNRPKSFFSGVDRLDLGLTTMSHGTMSNNTIPIQGLRLKGKINRTFYDVAAGTTVPNRIMSNSVFDQVNLNSQNIFNLNQFYTINTSRFVSSAVVGYGKQDENFVSFENYYNGRELKDIFVGKSDITNWTSNLSGGWSPIKNWTVQGSIGKTFGLTDTIQRSFNDDLAYSGLTKYKLSKLRTELSAKYKHIGSSYDGYSQGLYNSGFTRQEYGVSTKLAKNFQLQFVYQRQQFNSKNSSFKGLKTESASVDFQWNVTKRLLLFGGYTLLNASGKDTLAKGLNHLGKGGFVHSRQFKSFRSEIKGSSAVSRVHRIDSSMQMLNLSIEGDLDWKIIGAGLQITYQDYQGMNLVYGTNWIIKPEVKLHTKQLNVLVGMQLLRSEQFGFKNGGHVKFQFKPSEFFMWDITFMRWLPTEALYIPNYDTKKYVPYYFDLKMRVFI